MRTARKNQRGQAMVLAVLCLGVVMASIVIFGSNRSKDAAKTAGRVEQSQSAYEALAGAAKRVQSMYANEAGCDPESLDARLSRLPNLPDLTANPSALNLKFGGYDLVYPVANPSKSGANRENRCTGGTSGCRQMAIPVDNFAYIVTAGVVSRDADARAGDCPRDASVFLSTAVNGSMFYQRVTLTNVCSLQSCTGRGFNTQGTITLTATPTTTACTGSYSFVRSTKYGGGFTDAANNVVSMDDLQWARRYLETGGEAVGETNFLFGSSSIPSGTNGSCPPASSAGQCVDKNCFPFLDLNRDGKNNEADLAILENFLRGYLTTMPVNDGMN